MDLSPDLQRFWQAYLAQAADPAEADQRFYEAFRIGNSEASADAGAALILAGLKTTTSSLLWGYAARGQPLPPVGSLSIVLTGRGMPVCVVETTAVAVVPFHEVDADFAAAYGEWDRTLATWREKTWAYYAAECVKIPGREPAETMPLVCEWFRVVYPEQGEIDAPTHQ